MGPYLKLLRPPDWIKNVFVFAALGFGDRIWDAEADWLSLVAFAAFCMTASAGYIVNDILDRERDRQHPTKRDRPLASGAISLPTAIIMMVTLLVLATIICIALLPVKFWYVLVSYLVLTISYSLYFKHLMILDVLMIAVLFVLRALGGAFAINVPVSYWLLVCTFMLCMFIGFGKRRCEIVMLGEGKAKGSHRATLAHYTSDLLTHLLSTSAGIAIMTFLLYTLDRDTSTPFGEHKHRLVYTLPLVVYGIFRYAMLIGLGQATGPTELIVKDRPFQITVILWVAATALLLYADPAGL